MFYFLDSADINTVKKALDEFPMLDGVTTNPIILSRDIKKEMSLSELLHELRDLTKGKKLFVQVCKDDAHGMTTEAEKIVSSLGGDICVKLPSTKAGFCAIKALKDEGISTTATACYTTSQAIMAAKSGADFVAPYISHIDNLSLCGAQIAGEMARQLDFFDFPTEVLAASFRTASQVESCLANGVGAVTVTYDMLNILSCHFGTDGELSSFKSKWSERFDKDISELL